MDILGESSFFKNKISQYLPIGERASDKMFIAKLPPKIEPGSISEPSQLPPRTWIDSSTSECKLPTKTAACNDRNDQQIVKMMLSRGHTDLKCVAMTTRLDNTGPIGSGQVDQFPVPILKMRTMTNVWPKNAKMLTMIKAIIEFESPCPAKPEFCFKMTLEAAEKNFMVLKRHNFELGKVIEVQSKSPVGYGSEFWKPWILSPLLGNHPLWPKMKSILKNGSQWPTKPILEEERIGNVKEALEFGNHKGAKSQLELLLKLVSNNVI
jgi:hypothetical protein